jgi:hypothetical protein
LGNLLLQKRCKGGFDPQDSGVLIGEFFVAQMNEHGRIDLEQHDPAIGRQAAINSEMVKGHPLLNVS